MLFYFQYVTDIGGTTLDDQAEIQNAVNNVLNAMDSNKDDILKAEDLSKYWTTLG
jgi:hypothetical protein